MAKRETDTITLPAYWASAIINGDYSSLEDPAEAQRCRDVVSFWAQAGWDIVDCEEEARFTWHYQSADPGADCTGGDVLDYTMIKYR